MIRNARKEETRADLHTEELVVPGYVAFPVTTAEVLWALHVVTRL